MKRIDCHTDAGIARLTDAQYMRMLALMEVLTLAAPYDDPTAQTEADWSAARQRQAQLDADADARTVWP